MLEIPDDFEINRSVIKENSSFQELNTLLEETRNFMYEMSFLAYGRDNIKSELSVEIRFLIL